MAFYNKIGLLVLSEDRTKFLVCEKGPEYDTTQYLMPGGTITQDEHSDEECLRNEIEEELGCGIDFVTLEYIGEYEDIAAGWQDRDVSIKLYSGQLKGIPRPCSEVDTLHWIGKEDAANPRVSAIVRNKILPDLVRRDIVR